MSLFTDGNSHKDSANCRFEVAHSCNSAAP